MKIRDILKRSKDRLAANDVPATDRDGVMTELASIQEELVTQQAELSRLIDMKYSGNLHDGPYNIAVSYIGQRTDYLKGREQLLLGHLERLQVMMARTALCEMH